MIQCTQNKFERRRFGITDHSFKERFQDLTIANK